MAQRTFHEAAHDGRSVLGMLEVQVERDPKTGATVVRSVAPVSALAGAPNVATVFDDGRKSIHAVGRAAAQPSSEELGQILNAIDGVGMRALLDEVTVTPAEEGVQTEEEGAGEASDTENTPFISHRAAPKEENPQFERFGRDQVEAEEKHAMMVVRDVAEQVDHIEEQRLEEGPVTLMFLGYADATSGGDDGREDDEGGVIAVERVIITDDGEELLVEPQTPESTPDREAEQDVGKDRRGFQDVPLDANGGGGGGGGEVVREDGDKAPRSSSPSKKAEEGKAKPKTCQCCSVM